MTEPVLISVAFDGEIRLAPMHKATRSIALALEPREWVGWRVEVDADVVRVYSPPVGPKPDADRLMRDGASTCETVIPRHRCVVAYAHPPAERSAPSLLTEPQMRVIRDSEREPTTMVGLAEYVPATAPAPLAPAAPTPAPTPRARKLPPGALPDVVPPPGRIDVKEITEPAFASALVIE